jgi:tripartite-type tricarboxylate transporter receptor subunit TctC
MKPLIAALACGLAALLWRPLAAAEAGWPMRPIHLVVPGGPGGVTDIRGRWLADRLAPALGQRIVVENRTGAGGNVGMEAVARSAPDGYTLVIVHQGIMTVNPHLYAHPGYDPLSDFVPITHLGVGPLMLAVPVDSKLRSVADLVQLAKARPGQLSFGSPGIGTPPHLAGELFKRLAGVDTVHVPYKGGGQAVADLIAGHLSYSIEGLTVQLPQVKAGRLRALAVTGPRRVASLPEVPTMAEAGVPGYAFEGWVGIAAPAGTPPPIVARLYAEISRILATPEARDWFGAAGAEPGADPPEAFAAMIRAEHAKWGRIVHEVGITLE